MFEIELFDRLTNDWYLIELLVIHRNTWYHLSLKTCWTEMFEIELFDRLTNDWYLIELLVIHRNTWYHLSLKTCWTEMFEIELFDRLTVYKQRLNLVKVNN